MNLKGLGLDGSRFQRLEDWGIMLCVGMMAPIVPRFEWGHEVRVSVFFLLPPSIPHSLVEPGNPAVHHLLSCILLVCFRSSLKLDEPRTPVPLHNHACGLGPSLPSPSLLSSPPNSLSIIQGLPPRRVVKNYWRAACMNLLVHIE